jgi:tyrosine-specific transport protein
MANQTSPQAGSLFGGILLIAGSCIGAGMLGLPVLSAFAGFVPSLVMLLLAWLFMLSTGLLVLEVNLWFFEEVSLVTMAGRTLGIWGKLLSWSGFLFLFYAIMVAYIAGCGQLSADFISTLSGLALPPALCGLLLTLFFTIFLYLGARAVDLFNRTMVVGLIISYLTLVALGLPYIQPQLLYHQDWSLAFIVLPTMIISFGYHNLIPSLKNYIGHDAKKLRIAIAIGSAIPLVVYLLWEILILGLIPLEGEGGFRHGLDQGDLATQLLKGAIGSPYVGLLAEYFAFFAIVTSFLGVGLSFVDFLADGLHIKKIGKSKLALCAMVVAPPYLFSLFYPKVFIAAINYAGAFGVVLLFGILPVAMVWSGRYRQRLGSVPQLPGGKLTLSLVLFYALAVILLQIASDAGWL